MPNTPNIAGFCGVILAAGGSSRMGRDKALLPWRDETFLSGTIQLLRQFTELVVVVAGKNAAALTGIVHSSASYLVVNPAPDRGQFSSLQVGLQAVLSHGRDSAVIALVDRPPASRETVRALFENFRRVRGLGKWAVIPQYRGHDDEDFRHGHPIVVGREMIEAFIKAEAGSTAREVEHANQARIEYVTVIDPLTVINVDTPEEYQDLLAGDRG